MIIHIYKQDLQRKFQNSDGIYYHGLYSCYIKYRSIALIEEHSSNLCLIHAIACVNKPKMFLNTLVDFNAEQCISEQV